MPVLTIIRVSRMLVKGTKKALRTEEDPADVRLVDLVKKRAVEATSGDHVVIETRDKRGNRRRHKVRHKDIEELERKIGTTDLEGVDETQLTTKDVKLLHLLIDTAKQAGNNMMHGDHHEYDHDHSVEIGQPISGRHEKELEARLHEFE